MKCPKCEGRGWNDNQRYWNAKSKYQTDYYMRFEPTVKCNKCKGSGYIIGNIKEILGFLKHLVVAKFANDKEYQDYVRECIAALKDSCGNKEKEQWYMGLIEDFEIVFTEELNEVRGNEGLAEKFKYAITWMGSDLDGKVERCVEIAKQYSDSKLSELEKWVDEQFKHADSLDKLDDTETRYFAGKKDGISLMKIKLQSLK